MTKRAWQDSRWAWVLFGAAVVVVALSSMPPAMARVAQPEANPIGANAAETMTQSRTAAPGAGAVPAGQRDSLVADFIQIRLAADTHERQRELFDPHDSPLDETRYHPGRGYNIPWHHDPLFGKIRRFFAAVSRDGRCARCSSRNEAGTKRRVGQTKKHSPAAPGIRGHALALPLDLPANARE